MFGNTFPCEGEKGQRLPRCLERFGGGGGQVGPHESRVRAHVCMGEGVHHPDRIWESRTLGAHASVFMRGFLKWNACDCGVNKGSGLYCFEEGRIELIEDR